VRLLELVEGASEGGFSIARFPKADLKRFAVADRWRRLRAGNPYSGDAHNPAEADYEASLP
jgi:hypothetical protein